MGVLPSGIDWYTWSEGGFNDETVAWTDYVTGTALLHVENIQGYADYQTNQGWAYMWVHSTDWSEAAYIVQGSPGTALCNAGCGITYWQYICRHYHPSHGYRWWGWHSCYKDVLTYNANFIYIRVFMGVTTGYGATDNWDGNSTVVTNDFNLWLFPQFSDTQGWVLRHWGPTSCGCCTEQKWGHPDGWPHNSWWGGGMGWGWPQLYCYV